MIDDIVNKYITEGGFKDLSNDIADALNDLLSDGWDAVDATKEVAKKYKVKPKQVNQAYEDSYGMKPSEFDG